MKVCKWKRDCSAFLISFSHPWSQKVSSIRSEPTSANPIVNSCEFLTASLGYPVLWKLEDFPCRLCVAFVPVSIKNAWTFAESTCSQQVPPKGVSIRQGTSLLYVGRSWVHRTLSIWGGKLSSCPLPPYHLDLKRTHTHTHVCLCKCKQVISHAMCINIDEHMQSSVCILWAEI